MAVIQQVERHIQVTLGATPTAKVLTRTVKSVKVTQQGARGPQGERGEQGPAGAVGPAGDPNKIDAPDFTLIFDNQLV